MARRMSERNRRRLADYLRRQAWRASIRGDRRATDKLQRKADGVVRGRGKVG